jgi:hypothetical protein
VSPDERDGESSGVVHADNAGITRLVFEQRCDEAHGGADGEEEHECVALLPGPPQRFPRSPSVEARVGPRLR